jgi:CDP-diacylglycerol---glycerol-3-phosphate 3-phosphatidyltransferase
MRPNLPNSITIFRILLIPVFMTFLLGAVPYGAVLAALTFAVAAASDSLDGYFARRRRQITVTGAFLDPLADKLLVTAALLALIELGKLSAWVAMVIIAREFAVSGLRMVAAAADVIIPASRWGKAKTVSQMLAIMVLIIDPALSLAGRTLGWYLLMLAVGLTIVSGADYFLKAREPMARSKAPPGGSRAVGSAEGPIVQSGAGEPVVQDGSALPDGAGVQDGAGEPVGGVSARPTGRS